jgi:hypothetical protein
MIGHIEGFPEDPPRRQLQNMQASGESIAILGI